MDEVQFTRQEVIDLALSLLDAVDRIEDAARGFDPLADELRAWAETLTGRL